MPVITCLSCNLALLCWRHPRPQAFADSREGAAQLRAAPSSVMDALVRALRSPATSHAAARHAAGCITGVERHLQLGHRQLPAAALQM